MSDIFQHFLCDLLLLLIATTTTSCCLQPPHETRWAKEVEHSENKKVKQTRTEGEERVCVFFLHFLLLTRTRLLR